jgi:fimbrial isopeptide formation D2 family protein/LPXTG-motif cell wall-anchored protein
MKKGKKFLALGAAVAVALSTIAGLGTATVFAAGYGITVNTTNPGVSDKGQTFDAYKIFDVTVQGTAPNQTYTYTLVSPAFDNFTAYTSNKSYTAGESFTDYMTSLANQTPSADNSAEMNTLAAELYKYITDNGIAIAGSADGTGTNTVTIPLTDEGYYLVYGKAATTLPDGSTPGSTPATVVAACALTTTNPTATVDLKVGAPQLTKKVWNDNTGKWDTATDNQIGTMAQFQLSSYVPVMTGYSAYQYIIHDTVSAGLTFDPSNANIQVLMGTTPVPSQYYRILTTGVSPDTFQIVFDPVWFVTQTTGDAITVNYSAEVNSNAIIASKGNPNTVNLEYSDSPYDQYVPGTTSHFGGHHGKTGKTPDTTVIVYTYNVNIVKDNGKNEDLADANFILIPATAAPTDGSATILDQVNALANIPSNQTVTTPSNALSFTAPSGTGADSTTTNTYTVADTTQTTGTTTDIVSPTTGAIDLQGLDAGTYYLVETQSPSGYNKLTAPIVITITSTAPDTTGAAANDADFTVSYTNGPDTQQGTSTNGNNSFIIEVINNTGNIFPSTGGVGTTIFYAGGAVVMCLAVAGLILVNIRRKKRTATKEVSN